jgi:putative transposase
VLRIVGVNEATYYYRKNNDITKPKKHSGGRPVPGYSLNKQNKPISDEQIKEWLLELIAGEESAYGYRKLTLCLNNQYGLIINKKKVYRLCKELDILAPQRQQKLKHPRRIAVNREITGSNQLWEMDIKYGYIAGENRFFYLLGVIDVFDRAIIDYHIGLNCEGKHAASLIERCLWRRKLLSKQERPVIRTDNGPQFISNVFEEACENYNTEHERIPPKTPNKNAHIESFHAILERECLIRYEFKSYQEAYQVTTEFIQFYNKRRIHGSLKDLSPEVFSQRVAAGNITGIVVRV